MNKTCAICADLVDAEAGTLEPLGRDDALVFVCSGCATERPVAKFGPERGFEPQGSLPQRSQGKGAPRITPRMWARKSRA